MFWSANFDHNDDEQYAYCVEAQCFTPSRSDLLPFLTRLGELLRDVASFAMFGPLEIYVLPEILIFYGAKEYYVAKKSLGEPKRRVFKFYRLCTHKIVFGANEYIATHTSLRRFDYKKICLNGFICCDECFEHSELRGSMFFVNFPTFTFCIRSESGC